MIMRRVFDRYPNLTVVFQEGGYWWVPFIRCQMDEFYEIHSDDVKITPWKHAVGDDYLDRRPSEYFRDNFYLTTQPIALLRRSGQARDLLDLSMAQNMFVYSSDWPHRTLDLPTWYYTSRAFDKELRQSILHDNAEETLNL